MHTSSRVHSFILASTFTPFLFVLTGCDTIKDHLELGAIEMQLEHFERTANKLEPLTAPATKRTGAQIATVGNKLYFLGGFNTAPELAGETESYDPASKTHAIAGTWTNPSLFARKLVRGTDLCVDTGEGGATKFECYDTVANTWRTLPALPTGTTYHAGTAGDQLYAISDDKDNQPGEPAFKFDPKTNMWTSISNYPGACWPTHLIGVDATLYVLPCSEKTPIYRYDAMTDMWTAMPLPAMDNQLFAPHLYATTVVDVVGGEILCFNESKSSGSSIAIFSPAKYDEATMMSGVRYAAPFAPITTGGRTTAATSDTYWIAVNNDKSGICGQLHSYVPATDTWTTHLARPADKRVCVAAIGALGEDVFMLTSLQERSATIK